MNMKTLRKRKEEKAQLITNNKTKVQGEKFKPELDITLPHCYFTRLNLKRMG